MAYLILSLNGFCNLYRVVPNGIGETLAVKGDNAGIHPENRYGVLGASPYASSWLTTMTRFSVLH